MFCMLFGCGITLWLWYHSLVVYHDTLSQRVGGNKEMNSPCLIYRMGREEEGRRCKSARWRRMGRREEQEEAQIKNRRRYEEPRCIELGIS